MQFCPCDNVVEDGAEDKSCWEGCVPMIANASIDSKGVFEGEIGDGDEYDV